MPSCLRDKCLMQNWGQRCSPSALLAWRDRSRGIDLFTFFPLWGHRVFDAAAVSRLAARFPAVATPDFHPTAGFPQRQKAAWAPATPLGPLDSPTKRCPLLRSSDEDDPANRHDLNCCRPPLQAEESQPHKIPPTPTEHSPRSLQNHGPFLKHHGRGCDTSFNSLHRLYAILSFVAPPPPWRGTQAAHGRSP